MGYIYRENEQRIQRVALVDLVGSISVAQAEGSADRRPRERIQVVIPAGVRVLRGFKQTVEFIPGFEDEQTRADEQSRYAIFQSSSPQQKLELVAADPSVGYDPYNSVR